MVGRVRAVAAREAADVPRASGVTRAAAMLRAHAPFVAACRDLEQALVGAMPYTDTPRSEHDDSSASDGWAVP
jgi:hypothetical protein